MLQGCEKWIPHTILHRYDNQKKNSTFIFSLKKIILKMKSEDIFFLDQQFFVIQKKIITKFGFFVNEKIFFRNISIFLIKKNIFLFSKLFFFNEKKSWDFFG